MEQDLLRFTTAGSVDDGKSTLIGRLLYEAGALYDDHVKALHGDSQKFQREGLDLSLVTDGLRVEREQGITIDVAYRYFSTPKRHFIIADTPGHEHYTRNMATGASTADLAVILIDVSQGLTVQSRRHAFIASLLGIKHIVVVVNKMDLAGYAEEAFLAIRRDFEDFAVRLGVPDLVFIPASALKGDNVVKLSPHMPWYHGVPLLYHLENVSLSNDINLIDLRFPVQHVLRTVDGSRVYAGKVLSGVVRAGEPVLILPSYQKTRVRSLVEIDGPSTEAFAPQSTALTLEDECDIARGDMIVHPGNIPHVVSEVEAIVVWMDQTALEPGKIYYVKHTTRLVRALAVRVHFMIDPVTLSRKETKNLGLNDIGRVSLRFLKPIFCDEYQKNRHTGNFIMIDPDTNMTSAAGMILERGTVPVHIHPHAENISIKDRQQHMGQRPATLWFTGMSGSGKSSMAFALEKMLMVRGHFCVVLDGDSLRNRLNKDLGFSPEARRENIRRTAEIARLFNESGFIVIVALISPCQVDRLMAKDIIGEERFLEVHVHAPIEVCEQRDPKGLYKKARAGLIPEFTGISSPYEPPEKPVVLLNTNEENIEACVHRLWELLEEKKFLSTHNGH